MNFRNLTANTINWFASNGEVIVLEPAKNPAYVEQNIKMVDHLESRAGGIYPICKVEYGKTVNLPEGDDQDYTVLVVDHSVKAANPHRKDLATVDGLIYDDNGNVKGCTMLLF